MFSSIHLKNSYLKSKKVIDSLVSYIKNNIDMNLCHYQSLNIEHVRKFSPYQCYVQGMHNGYDMFLLFVKLNDVYYSVCLKTIDLFSNKEITLLEVDIKANITTYDGTIIRCIYIPPINTFYINDVYLLENMNFQRHSIKYKFINLKNYMLTNFETKNCKYYIHMNTLYSLRDINKCLELIKSEKKYFNGLIFNSNISYIYIFKDKEIDNFKPAFFSSKSKIDHTKIFVMEKTKIIDVYKLFSNNHFVSVAYVKNIDYSHLYRSWFQDTEKNTVLCYYNEVFKKWVPIKIIDENKIDNESEKEFSSEQLTQS